MPSRSMLDPARRVRPWQLQDAMAGGGIDLDRAQAGRVLDSPKAEAIIVCGVGQLTWQGASIVPLTSMSIWVWDAACQCFKGSSSSLLLDLLIKRLETTLLLHR